MFRSYRYTVFSDFVSLSSHKNIRKELVFMANFLHLENPDSLMLIDVIYHRASASTDWTDCLDIVYKDLTTNEKKLKTIVNPTVDIYYCKDEYRDYKYNKRFMELDKVRKVTVPYKDVTKCIAEEAGGDYKDYYYQCRQNRQFAKTGNLHKWRYVFGSDLDIEQWYRVQWVLNYTNELKKPISRGFMDIEVDIIDVKGFPESGECPVNAVTLVDADGMTCYTLLYDDGKNPQIDDFRNNIESFKEELHEAFDETYGVLDYKIFMYEDEKQFIEQLFALIHFLKLDFIMIWNMRFDIPFLIERYKVLGGDPVKLRSHKDFKYKEAWFKIDKTDTKRKIDVANRGDFFHASSYSVFYDQMVLYAGLRKGRAMLRSNRLTYIAEKEIGDEKLDYSEDADLRHLPYVNYRKFVMYNIKDVLLQFGIDNKTQDIENLYVRSYTNATMYHKVFKQTALLKTRGHIEHFEQGLVMGNNINQNYGMPIEEEYDLFDDDEDDDDEDDDDVKFSGALVGDPRLNDYMGIEMFGKPSMYIFDYVVDFDFSSMDCVA